MNRYSLATATFVLGGLLGSYFLSPVLYGQQKEPTPLIQPAPQIKPALQIPREAMSFRDVVKRILPAVVSLEVNAKTKAEGPQLRGDMVPAQDPGPGARPGFGSGVLIDQRGYVLTSLHVVDGAPTVEVTLADGRKVTSRDIRGDRKTDLAIIVLDAKAGPYPFLELGDSDAMEIGDHVLAVGSPFGLSGSVTQGIVSGKGRNGLNLNAFEDFLQTDAAINPGNSGGPLIALDGKVVGINAAIKSKNGGFQGVGLAVASNLCRSVATGLMADGVVRRGYLGLQAREVSPTLAKQLKHQGVVVSEVFDKTPAAKAGLKAGDVITAFGGRQISDTKTLQSVVQSSPLNVALEVRILRNGKAQTLTIKIEEQPADYGN